MTEGGDSTGSTLGASLELRGDPRTMGRVHGATFRRSIRRFAAERMNLAISGSWSGGTRVQRGDVLALAESTLAAHEQYAPDLVEEMTAIASAADISVPEAMVLGGFTDLVDLVRSRTGTGPREDDCTAILARSATDGRPRFAQTWDMHTSAAAHVRLLRLEPDSHPMAVVLTTTGCLGQIGMNEAGIVVGITNLAAQVGRVGVTWPFVVRRALQQTSLAAAVRCVTEARLAGGHNYLLAGPDEAVAIEAMPAGHVVTKLGSEALVRTNHCLDPQCVAAEASDPPALASSRARYDRAHELIAHKPVDDGRLQAVLRDTTAICQRPDPVHDVATIAAVTAAPATGDLWITTASPATTEFEHVSIREASRLHTPGSAG